MRWHRLAFHTVGASFSLTLSLVSGLLLATLAAVLVWCNAEGSLAQALWLVKPLLPTGQTLQASDVRGTVARGGQIGHLRWTQKALRVELQDLQVAWDWRALLQGELRLTLLQATALHVEDRNPSSGGPFTEMGLPLHVDATFSVGRVEWAGPPDWTAQNVRGRYRFDGTTHRLEGAGLQIADGTYRLDASLQAALPGALRVRASGSVAAALQARQPSLLLQASAGLEGTLYGKDALLNLVLDLQPHAKEQALGAAQAHLQAQLRPAQAQALQSASGQWSALDLSALWPQAPQTRLHGQLQVAPQASGWSASVQMQNRLEGPWSQNRLPLGEASASLLHRDGRWQVERLQAQLAGGTLAAQGSYSADSAQWAAKGSLRDVDLARIDPRWGVAVLDAEFTAQQTPQGTRFDVQAGSAAQRGGGTPVRAQAQGVWSAPVLALQRVAIQTAQAQLGGQLEWNARTDATRLQLQGQAPGAQGSVSGQISAEAGQGSSEWKVRDAKALLQWLQTLPWVGSRVAGLDAQGEAQASLRWDGGWQSRGNNLKVSASLQSSRLDLQDRYRLRDVQLDVSGTLAALDIGARGELQLGNLRTALQSQSQLAAQEDGAWQLRVAQLQARLQDGLQAVPWNLQLQQPLTLDWQRSALAQSASVSAGSLRLVGPTAGTALVQWEPVRWSQQGGPANATAARWSSRGKLQGIPMAWLEVLGQARLANLGLRGDVVLAGDWDASGGNGLQVRARVQRSEGDLQLLAGDGTGTFLPAGLREASVQLQVARDAVQASLVWASNAAGNARVDFSTRLSTAEGTSFWSADAPVQGTVQANLPRVGAWSLFAPVGWRINGTLQADATLSGSRSKPAWKGSLQARDVAIRSVVDGIDLSAGSMRFLVDGQHMDIDEFVLQGAGGASGGQLVVGGTLDWLPAAAGSPVVDHVRMALVANARAFRVTARPDQRLVVSGNVSANLTDANLQIRGALQADQAMIVLPEDTAPRLGSDVVVKRSKSPAKTPAHSGSDPASRVALTVVPDVVLTLDPGSSFQIQGRGLSTRLAGILVLQAQGRGAQPRLTGELRTVNGSYRAYGQRLTIEEGTLRFTGAYDNPALDIRAVRPNLPQVVGVHVSGTAQLPVVRLYAEPELSDMEKLSWLVLGRSSANGGSETLILQQAALALFAGSGSSQRENLVSALGLDEVSLGQTAITNLDGTAGTETSVKIGKRLSRDFYVAYERSLAGTLGTLYVFYDLSRRFTLRGESGATTGVDLIFTTRYD